MTIKYQSGDGPIYVSILVLLAIACVFTIAGGLTAVIWTDFIQVRLIFMIYRESILIPDNTHGVLLSLSFSPVIFTFTFPDNPDDRWCPRPFHSRLHSRGCWWL